MSRTSMLRTGAFLLAATLLSGAPLGAQHAAALAKARDHDAAVTDTLRALGERVADVLRGADVPQVAGFVFGAGDRRAMKKEPPAWFRFTASGMLLFGEPPAPAPDGAPSVVLLGDEVAVVAGTDLGTEPGEGEGVRPEHRRAWTAVFQRDRDGWRLVHLHASTAR